MAALVGCRGVMSEPLYRYWPRVPRPRTLIRVPFVGNHEDGMVYETAAGLAAKAVRDGKGELLLCEDTDNSGYQRWYAQMKAVVKPRVEGPTNLWAAVSKLHKLGIVRGYVLYRYDSGPRGWHASGAIDESANVATSLAAVLGGIAVSERLQPSAEKLGLPLLLDARDRTEAWCLKTYEERCARRGSPDPAAPRTDRSPEPFETFRSSVSGRSETCPELSRAEAWCLKTYEDRFSREVVMTADPKSRVARSEGVALGAFVVSQPGPVYEAALARCKPDCPVLGWGCGGEDTQTLPSSQWGLFQTATNWCHNLPLLSTEEVGKTIPQKSVSLPARCRASLRDLKWEDDVHYVAFLMSDGDNVQWLMGNFAGGTEGHWYYESPARGKFPFGWTFPYANLAQLCPYTLVDLFARATPNDDFVPYGNGYLYPDHFGAKRPKTPGQPDPLTLHARRLGEYMRFGGLHTLAYNLQDWDGPQALTAYDTLAREIPTLDGVFTVQYYPYSGGEGRILWAKANGRSVPVISCRLCIWANTGRPRDSTPAGVAKWLNGMPRGGATWSDDNFSFVMPHAWSRFRDTKSDPSTTAEEKDVDQDKDAPDTARGLLPVQWTVERLDKEVKVVTPAQLALLVKLHLRTRETLAAYLADLRPRVQATASKRAKDLLAQAGRLLPSLHDGDSSGKRCFELLREADRLITR